jgi:hypothetical protein
LTGTLGGSMNFKTAESVDEPDLDKPTHLRPMITAIDSGRKRE